MVIILQTKLRFINVDEQETLAQINMSRNCCIDLFEVFEPLTHFWPCSYLIPLKTLENVWFSGVFKGYKMETLAENGLKIKKLKNKHRKELTNKQTLYCFNQL